MRRAWIGIIGISLAALVYVLVRDASRAADEGAPLIGASRTGSETSRFAGATGVAEHVPVLGLAETDSVSATSAQVEVECELVIRHADGMPARGCVVVMERDQRVAWRGITDEAGTVRGAVVRGAVVAWVAGATLAPVAFRLSETRGRHELTLPAGEVIAGRILVDGGPPPEPVPLGLVDDDTNIYTPIWPVRGALRPFRPGYSDPHVDFGQLVGGDGTFRFSGLPVGWAGEFDLPFTYFSEDDEDFAAHAPMRDRVLRLHRVPHIRFRVVIAGTTEPVPFALVEATVFGDRNANSNAFSCDIDGRADLPMLRWEPALRIELELANPDGSLHGHHVVAIPEATHDIDLGDFGLSPWWRIPFVVRTPDRQPLAGAIAATECDTLVRSERTDEQGASALEGVPPGCAEMRVAAPRCEIVRIQLPPQPPTEPIDVTLTPCPWLTLRLASEDGEPRPGLELVMATSRRVTAAEARSSMHEEMLTLELAERRDRNGATERTSMPQADGSVVQRRYSRWDLSWDTGASYALGCVQAGESVQLALIDRSTHPVWTSTVTLAAGEAHEELAVVSALPRSIEVLVTDEGGVSLADVAVEAVSCAEELRPERAYTARVRTDENGRAFLTDLYAPLVDIYCSPDGYAPAQFEGVEPGGAIRIVLAAGKMVVLHCVDADGRPAPADEVWWEGGGGDAIDLAGEETRQGVPQPDWRLVDLPPSVVQLVADMGGRRFTLEHDARSPDATLVVPAYGAVEIRGLRVTTPGESASLRISEPGLDGGLWGISLEASEIHAGSVTLPVVFAGRYQLELVEGWPARRLGQPVEFSVRAGEQTTVVIP